MGTQELVIILVIVLVLFGGRKLPDLASSLGKSIREFRKASDEADREEAERRARDEDAPRRDDEV